MPFERLERPIPEEEKPEEQGEAAAPEKVEAPEEKEDPGERYQRRMKEYYTLLDQIKMKFNTSEFNDLPEKIKEALIRKEQEIKVELERALEEKKQKQEEEIIKKIEEI